MRVDIDRAEQIQIELGKREKELLKEIRSDTGVAVEPWSAASVKAFDALGLKYHRTENTMLPPLQNSLIITRIQLHRRL